MESVKYTVEGVQDTCSIKEYLLCHGFSVNALKEAKLGGIFLNGKPVTVRARIKSSDKLEVHFPQQINEHIEPIDMPIKVVYEDDYLIAVDKPGNMPTHPSRGNHLPTLANAIVARYGRDFVFRAVNRLDRDTSGLVIIAKDRLTAYALSDSMKTGGFVKRYTCLVEGVPDKKHGIIDAPIRRESEGSIKRTVALDGKLAVTEYTVNRVFGANAFCEIILHTGRTHQIRVHMAHIGHPLVGDFLYGKRNDSGYYLRCTEISFPHPKDGKMLKIDIK